ncbi:unnamed protein product [Dicrocoelium dendriticum]|nr:unnamed protein product [Dicrocoelium dendriticum]
MTDQVVTSFDSTRLWINENGTLKSQSDADEDVQYLKYRPKFPLPEELRILPREATICQYCGVSYLVLSEIKHLEEKLLSLRCELENIHRKQSTVERHDKRISTEDLSSEHP